MAGESSSSGSPMTTIYVALVNEATSVWRPVDAVRVADDTFRIAADEVPTDEQWEFAPGATVRCEQRELSEGSSLVAVELVRSAI